LSIDKKNYIYLWWTCRNNFVGLCPVFRKLLKTNFPTINTFDVVTVY